MSGNFSFVCNGSLLESGFYLHENLIFHVFHVCVALRGLEHFAVFGEQAAGCAGGTRGMLTKSASLRVHL